MAELYEPNIYHSIRPPDQIEGLVKHQVDFNALPAPTRERLAAILNGKPSELPRWLGFGGQGCSPTCLMGVGLPAIGFLGVAALFFVFRYTDYRVPSAPMMFPVFLAGLVGLLVFPALGYRKRALASHRPYIHDCAYLYTARHVVWVNGDKVTLVALDPARLYCADVIDASSKAVKGAYVKLQLGTKRVAFEDTSIGAYDSRAIAEERLRAIQEDLSAKRGAIQEAVARGDAVAAGALDPFWEIGEGWAALEAAGAPATCAEGPAIDRARQVSPLINYAPLMALAPVFVGGCCLSGVVNFVADLATYMKARSEGTPEAFADYIGKGSYFDGSAAEARQEAIQQLVFGIRRETLGDSAWQRMERLEALLEKHPRGAHVEELQAEIERLRTHRGKLTVADGAIADSEEEAARFVAPVSALAHVKVGQRYIFSMSGTRQEWIVTGVQGDRVDYTMQNVDERGSRAVPTQWQQGDMKERSSGTALGEKTKSFGDVTLRYRGRRDDSGRVPTETWVAVDDDGVIFPGTVLFTRADARNELIEVLEPKD